MKKMFCAFIMVLFLVSCSTVPDAITEPMFPTPVSNDCIRPIVDFAFFPTGGERQGPNIEDKLPSAGWEFVSAVPNVPPKEEFGANTVYLDLIQSIEGKDKIWVKINGPEIRLFRYQIDRSKWDELKADKQFGSTYLGFRTSVPSLYLDKNNRVWLVGDVDTIEEVDADVPLLSVYDEASTQFRGILSINDFVGMESGEKIDRISIIETKLDTKGDFWFAVLVHVEGKSNEYRFYRFSPSTYRIERYLMELKYSDNNNASFVISEDNVLFLLDGENKTIIRHEPMRSEIARIPIPVQVVNNTNNAELGLSSAKLFLDSHQRLWIDDRGWLDLFPNGDWHIVVRSPNFIQYAYGQWSWPHPTFNLETKDGRLWYSSDGRGTGWVDTDTGNWCIFTSYPSNVVKDSTGNLWIIAAGKLYKYPTAP